MTIDDKRYLLASIAWKFASRSQGRYEVDELINEAWLNPHVRKAKETSLLWMAGRWAMISYMHKMQKDNRKRWKIKTCSLYNKEGRYVCEPAAVTPVDIRELREDLERMMWRLTPKQKRITNWIFQGDIR